VNVAYGRTVEPNPLCCSNQTARRQSKRLFGSISTGDRVKSFVHPDNSVVLLPKRARIAFAVPKYDCLATRRRQLCKLPSGEA
jgi:hypothetical protein